MKSIGKRLVFSILFFAALLLFLNNFSNKVNAAANENTGITTATINVYKGPGKSFGLTSGTVKKGEIITTYNQSNGWVYIRSNDDFGWVWGEYIEKSSGVGTLTAAYANLYKGPGKASGTFGAVKTNETLPIFKTTNGWTHIYIDGKSAWIWHEYITKVQGSAYPNASLNLYNGAGKKYGTKGTLEKGSPITYAEIKNGWRHIYLDGKDAWVWDSYLVKSNASTIYEVNINHSNYVNIYNTSTKSYGTKQKISNGTKATVLFEKSGWLYIHSGNTNGWIWGTYATPVAQTGKTTANVDVYDDIGGGKTSTLAANTIVTIYESKNGFSHIKTGDLEGWISAQTIQPQQAKSPNAKGANHTIYTVNVYKSANKSNGTIGSLPKGSDVTFFDYVNGWRYVQAGNIQGWVWDEYVNTYLTLDLLKPANVTAAEINNYISNYEKSTGKKSIIANKGQTFINAAKKYQINAQFLAALAIHESAYGTSNLSYWKNNLFGFKAYDVAPYEGAMRFSSIEEGIEYEAAYLRFAYLLSNGSYYNGSYLGDKSGGMNVRYSTDAGWGQKIANHMERIKPYNTSYYSSVPSQANSNLKMPNEPTNKDIYPVNSTMLAKKDLPLYNGKNGSRVGTIKKGEKFQLSEKHNDFWLKIKKDNKEYWTFFSFTKYKEYMSALNMLRLTTNGTIYEEPKTNSKKLAAIPNNSYIELSLDKDSKEITDDSGKWYQVVFQDKTGWISKSSVTKIYQ